MSAGPMVAGGGIGVVLIAIIALLLGRNPQQLVQEMQQQQQQAAQGDQEGGEEDDEQSQFVRVVLRDTEVVWTELFRQVGKEYEPTKLILFHNHTESGCGSASNEVGPFYCPRDARVYIDLAFYDELKSRFGAPGDFAQAYVLAHEVAHHVQNLLGISDQVTRQQAGAGQAEANRLSVRLELQADFLSGVWAHHAQKRFQILERGDVEEALNAANQIGDDRLQMQARGYVVKDSFTHGTAAQRAYWFREGLRGGNLEQLNELFERDYGDL